MSDVFDNKLTPAQLERLAILGEELGEAQQVIGKIIRHGYESGNPLIDYEANRSLLERECGHVYEAILMLCRDKDISESEVNRSQEQKKQNIKRWLHHQRRLDESV